MSAKSKPAKAGPGPPTESTSPKKEPKAHAEGSNAVNLRPILSKHLGEEARKGRHMELYLVSVQAFSLFTKLYGEEAGQQVMDTLTEQAWRLLPELFPGGKLLLAEQVEPGSVALIVSHQPNGTDKMLQRTLLLRSALRQQVNNDLVQSTGYALSLAVGYAHITVPGDGDLFSGIQNALADARQVAEGSLDEKAQSLLPDFRRLIDKPLLFSAYEPIVDLRRAKVLGWEALARGPENAFFKTPDMMFDFAEEVGGLFQLERVCRERAVAGLGVLEAGQKLFINIHPQTVGDPSFRSGETMRMLKQHGLDSASVVLEITERHTVRDFGLFYRTLHHYRSQGFQVAIDDVGTGHSGLLRIARIRPDYLKVDMSLIRGIDSNLMQQALVETLVTFSEKIGCTLIAEGIETSTELTNLISMGVRYGQGHYLARAAWPKPLPEPHVLQVCRMAPQGRPKLACSLPVRDLLQDAPQVPARTSVKAVKDTLDRDPISGAVVVDNGRAAGLVMSHHLDRLLGTQYGTSLYYNRQVRQVMDPQPLIVEESTPVEQVAEQAMSRDRIKLYDHIIVTSQGKPTGMVSVQHMLDALAKLQVEMARGANPLTGLPGGLVLEQEIEQRCTGGQPTSFIYVDLDNFKAYNDTYGFNSGDKMIKLLAKVLEWSVARHGQNSDLVGHIGGDDFVVITNHERAERISLAVVRCFKRLVKGLYDQADQRRGYVVAKGRDGRAARFPLVTVSLGILDIHQACGLDDIAQRAAEVKRWAKSRPGNVYVRDRRRPPAELSHPDAAAQMDSLWSTASH